MLTAIQQRLAGLYRLEPSFDIEEYVFARSEVEAPLDRPEQVLVLETDDALELALVLEDTLLHPGSSWDLDDFCVVAEGVSHLLYLFRVAERQGQVSQLELELQAEIDKFALLLFGGMDGADAIDSLFARASLRDDVTCVVEADRYEHAHRLAMRYCRWLLSRHTKATEPLLDELRRVYRMGGERKRAYVSECRP